jgi:hypothetical protein
MNQAVNPTAHPGRVGCQCCLLGRISWPTISRWTRLSTRKTSSSKLASPNANQAQLPAGYPKAQSPPNKAPSTRTSKAVSRDRPVSPLLLLIPSLLPHVIDPTSHPRKERAARSDRRDGRRVRPAPAPASPRGAAPGLGWRRPARCLADGGRSRGPAAHEAPPPRRLLRFDLRFRPPSHPRSDPRRVSFASLHCCPCSICVSVNSHAGLGCLGI